MANYIVIGGDQKEYGPITGDDVRKWIAEGRLNAQSLMKAESDAEWRPLSAFPEFADALEPAIPIPGFAPVLGAGQDQRKAALEKVKVPAVGLLISAIISFIMSTWGLISFGSLAAQKQEMDTRLSQLNNPQLQQFADSFLHLLSGPFGIINILFQMLVAVLIFTGALQMLKLRSYEFAFAAAILAMLPCITPCCGWLPGLIFGCWAMAVLGKVKPHFS